MQHKFISAFLFTIATTAFYAESHALPVVAETPPMGWNSWNHFGVNIDDATIRKQADAMVSSGMRDAGYTYINIDDGWEGTRDAHGLIRSNSKFPDMKALADYVHKKGLKLGIYSTPGPKTCQGLEGSYNHEHLDAQTFADWGVDYLKYDLCSFLDIMEKAGSPEKAHQLMIDAYTKMHNALEATSKPIVYSLSIGGYDAAWRWGSSVGANLWRTTTDIRDDYVSMSDNGFSQTGLASYAGPGHWNDPDMLEIGNGGMTAEEYRTHISLWAILASPLIAGNDLSKMSAETIAILTNKDVIAVDQDKAGKQGDRVTAEGPLEIWARPLADGSKAVGLFNRNENRQTITADFKKLGFTGKVKVRDLWLRKDLGEMEGKYTATVAGHGVVLLRLSGKTI
jgi:alpha-galactosidase